MSINRRMDKQTVISPFNRKHSAKRRNKLLIHAVTLGVDLENTGLPERGLTQYESISRTDTAKCW